MHWCLKIGTASYQFGIVHWFGVRIFLSWQQFDITGATSRANLSVVISIPFTSSYSKILLVVQMLVSLRAPVGANKLWCLSIILAQNAQDSLVTLLDLQLKNGTHSDGNSTSFTGGPSRLRKIRERKADENYAAYPLRTWIPLLCSGAAATK